MSFEKTYFSFYSSFLGEILLQGTNQGLTQLSFISKSNLEEIKKDMLKNKIEKNESFFKKACLQLDEYFAGKRKHFTLKLAPVGTTFQQRVWKALKDIPYGTTQSYLDIANNIDNPKAVRAVGRANGLNPIPLIIPCHRVIGASGKLTGYAYGLELKAQLLTLENAPFIAE